MSVRSVLKYARISSQKARQVTRAITGMPVSQALSVLDFTPKKAAFLVGKTLRSAIANAENNHEQDASEFIVQSATATPGPALSRIMPRARGSAAPIKKRMTHITVIIGAPKTAEAPAAGEAAAVPAKKAPAKKKAAPKARKEKASE
ncbi:MAG: 50S ribosomal protein L22 [Prosthecobacter sp.]|jgi:large subunit ribosomal protein L22|uniref:50S ribosomal protein L22 n=1 Tax=Prosthecobacter sp. TaxID=1965333 RepID=UPI001A09104B|nr:50S ribosomal protein L22 [Prosthecobacter sp.]